MWEIWALSPTRYMKAVGEPLSKARCKSSIHPPIHLYLWNLGLTKNSELFPLSLVPKDLEKIQAFPQAHIYKLRAYFYNYVKIFKECDKSSV